MVTDLEVGNTFEHPDPERRHCCLYGTACSTSLARRPRSRTRHAWCRRQSRRFASSYAFFSRRVAGRALMRRVRPSRSVWTTMTRRLPVISLFGGAGRRLADPYAVCGTSPTRPLIQRQHHESRDSHDQRRHPHEANHSSVLADAPRLQVRLNGQADEETWKRSHGEPSPDVLEQRREERGPRSDRTADTLRDEDSDEEGPNRLQVFPCVLLFRIWHVDHHRAF
jgi:hypothetical protein